MMTRTCFSLVFLALMLVSTPSLQAGVGGKSYMGTYACSTAPDVDTEACMAFDTGDATEVAFRFPDGPAIRFNGSYSEADLLFLSFWSAELVQTADSMAGISFFFGLFTTFQGLDSSGQVYCSGFFTISDCQPEDLLAGVPNVGPVDSFSPARSSSPASFGSSELWAGVRTSPAVR